METIDVLVVENDPVVKHILTTLFGIKSFSFKMTPSAEGGLELLKRYNFKVMLIDVNLGHGLNGVEFCIEVRKTNKISKIYAFTGFNNIFKDIKPEVAGFNGLFAKPVRAFELSETIKKDLKIVKFED